MKKYSIALKILGVCLVMVAGIWLGMQIHQNEIEKQAAYSDSLSTAVAVVNQDLGVAVGKQAVNYANAVIETLGSGYTVVSASVAQNGFEKGTYGAIVTFPTSFSESIVSINKANPNQAMLSLAINPDLPEERYIALYTQLISMQQQVNNNIAYAYVETVYQQLHAAQNEIDQLLANDETDMAVVNQVALANYTEMLRLGDIPKVEFEPTSLDFAQFLASAQTIADDMNQVYVDSYANAQADFAVVKSQISGYERDITLQSECWATDMAAWASNVSAHAQNILGYRQTLDSWRTDAIAYRAEEAEYYGAVNTFAADASSYFATEATALESSATALQDWRSTANATLSGAAADSNAAVLHAEAINAQAAEVDTAVAAYNTEVASLSAWLTYLQRYQNHLDDPVANPAPPEWPAAEQLPQALTVSPIAGNASASATEMNNALLRVNAAMETELSKLPPAYTAAPPSFSLAQLPPPLVEQVPDALDAAAPSEQAPAQPPQLADALTGIVTASAGYNPDAYFDDQTKSEAQQSITQYAGYLSDVESDLKANDAGNLRLLHSAYRDYNAYVGDLRINIYDVHSREQGILAANIGGLSDTLTNTSLQNHSLMDSFVSRMPNSRVNSTVNQKVVETTVTPIVHSYNYIRGGGIAKQESIGQWLVWLLIALGFVVLLDLLFIWKKARSHRAKEE